MYRKIVWCYVLVLTLLDISLNTKLTAQGKSHDVTVHDSLIEGISFQEWGKEADESSGVGRAGAALRLAPAALRFGRAALGSPHARTVTLTNAHNTTVHLASVAGTTPDFHASFFESKTLPPNGNTSFSVVYLGRREGPVAAHLYIHTSLGVHKYPVSAEGVASEWGVWPLVGLRVPHNATLDPLLTIYNPTDKHIQVREVYSSGAWVGLALPEGGGAAPGAAWRVPPHEERALVRLRLRLPAHYPPDPSDPHRAHDPHDPRRPRDPHDLHDPQRPLHHQDHAQPRPLTAYIRIKGDMSGGAQTLVVGVEASAAPPGEFLAPPQLRLRPRGSRDPPQTWDIAAGNSGAHAIQLEASVWGARCGPHPPPAPAPHDEHDAHHVPRRAAANGQALDHANGGAKPEGARVRVLRAQLDAHQPPRDALQLTLDYARLWASYKAGAGAEAEAAGAEGLWCGGWVAAGAAAAPYSVRLLPGTLTMLPPEIEVVTANKEEASREREVRVRNDFPLPLRINAVAYGPHVHEYFHTTDLAPLVVLAGGSSVVARLRLRAPADAQTHAQLRSHVALRTNVTEYLVPLLLHPGALQLEWEWPNSADGHLRVGAVSAGGALRVGVRVRNPTPAALCLRRAHVRLAHARLDLGPAAPAAPAAQGPEPCLAPGAELRARLELAAPAPGALAGTVALSSQHATTRAHVTLHAHPGRVRALPLRLPPAAPYAASAAPLDLDSSMPLTMRVLNVTQPQPHHDPALSFLAEGAGWVSGGRQAVGRVQYAPERACAPRCYTGLRLHTPEGAAWARRGAGVEAAEAADAAAAEAALREDLELLRARRALFAAAPTLTNITLTVHTNEVVGIPVTGSVRAHWPQLVGAGAGAAWGGAAWAEAAGAGGAGGALAGVGGATTARVRVRNPASRPLLLQPLLTSHRPHRPIDMLHPQLASQVGVFCGAEACSWSAAAFSVASWRGVRGAVEPWRAANWTHGFLLAPAAELELSLAFAPTTAGPTAAHLYLRNNLTIVEIIPLWGRGVYPSFEIGGRRPGSTSPLLFEVSSCPGAADAGGAEAEGGADGAAGAGVVVRVVGVRNTGAVGVRLREWVVAGSACGARGFRVQPCAPVALAPNETRALRLAFAPDYTLASVSAPLQVRTDRGPAEFVLRAVAPARLLRACGGARPSWEPALRAGGTLLALLALALVLAAAALDAERELRRARAARAVAPPPARAPLDLRAVGASSTMSVSNVGATNLCPGSAMGAASPRGAVGARRRRAARRVAPLDPQAERRAFERWRAEVLRRADIDDDHSSEEADAEQDSTPPTEPNKPSRSPSPVARASSDEEAPSLASSASVGSDSSRADRDESEPEAPPPASPGAAPRTPPRTPDARDAPRARRDTDTDPSEPPRRSERRGEEAGRARASGAAGARLAGRRAGAARRRAGVRAPGSPPRRSPPPPAEPRAPPALRWGATWSSVVAARAGTASAGDRPANHSSNGSPAPLPPIGSDVRRRGEAAAGGGAGAAGADHSLFYFNGEQPPAAAPDAAFPWRPAPAPERAPYPPPVHDYLTDYVCDEKAGLGGAFGSVWPGASSGAWAWGGGGGGGGAGAAGAGGAGAGAALRPPPGFHGPPPPPPRAYDPFRSLAAIWAPGALDWRLEPEPEPPHAAHTHAHGAHTHAHARDDE